MKVTLELKVQRGIGEDPTKMNGYAKLLDIIWDMNNASRANSGSRAENAKASL